MGTLDAGNDSIGRDQAVVARITIDLQHVAGFLQNVACLLSAPSGSIGRGYTGWPGVAPVPIIAGTEYDVVGPTPHMPNMTFPPQPCMKD